MDKGLITRYKEYREKGFRPTEALRSARVYKYIPFDDLDFEDTGYNDYGQIKAAEFELPELDVTVNLTLIPEDSLEAIRQFVGKVTFRETYTSLPLDREDDHGFPAYFEPYNKQGKDYPRQYIQQDLKLARRVWDGHLQFYTLMIEVYRNGKVVAEDSIGESDDPESTFHFYFWLTILEDILSTVEKEQTAVAMGFA